MRRNACADRREGSFQHQSVQGSEIESRNAASLSEAKLPVELLGSEVIDGHLKPDSRDFRSGEKVEHLLHQRASQSSSPLGECDVDRDDVANASSVFEMDFRDDEAQDGFRCVVFGDDRAETRLAKEVAKSGAGVGDAGRKALLIERKKGVEICALDVPEMNHRR